MMVQVGLLLRAIGKFGNNQLSRYVPTMVNIVLLATNGVVLDHTRYLTTVFIVIVTNDISRNEQQQKQARSNRVIL